MGRPVSRPPVRGSGVRSAVLPGLVPRQVAEDELAEVFELRPYSAGVKQEHSRVICGALLVVLARLLRARALRGLGLGGDQEGKDASEFCVAGMIGSIERSNLHSSSEFHIIEVQGAVAVMFSST